MPCASKREPLECVLADTHNSTCPEVYVRKDTPYCYCTYNNSLVDKQRRVINLVLLFNMEYRATNGSSDGSSGDLWQKILEGERARRD